MPLPRWLHSKTPPAPAPASGGAGPQGVPVTPAADPDVRIHMAAHDPAFPAKREAALAVILETINAVTAPFGYVRAGTTWARSSPRGKTAVHLQRSRYGFDATILLRFLPAEGLDLDGTIWAQEDDVRLLLFHSTEPGADPGLIFYLDVHDDPRSLDAPMLLLRDHALPWLEAHHQGVPDIGPFLRP